MRRGWLVPEPFIVPALYEKYMDIDANVNGDEWTLSQAMAKDTIGGGLKQLEDHYKTFIVSAPKPSPFDRRSDQVRQTEEDFAQIAGAGLNWVRLPISFHAFGTLNIEVCDHSPCGRGLGLRYRSHSWRIPRGRMR